MQRNHLGIDEREMHLRALSGTKVVSSFLLVGQASDMVIHTLTPPFPPLVLLGHMIPWFADD